MIGAVISRLYSRVHRSPPKDNSFSSTSETDHSFDASNTVSKQTTDPESPSSSSPAADHANDKGDDQKEKSDVSNSSRKFTVLESYIWERSASISGD